MNFLKRGFKAAKSAVGAIFGDDDDDASDGDRGGGWSHKREVVVERPRIPVVQYAVSRYGGEPMGGIQGLWWYARSLFVDPDGDVANQFIPIDGEGEPMAEGERDAAGGEGDGSNGARYRRALVEVAGVCRGNVQLKPASLD